MGKMTGIRVKRVFNNRTSTECIGDKTYTFRSQLEVKVATYLEFLRRAGDIKGWAYEQTTFHFPDQIICKKYIMDFDVMNLDGTFFYIEAKGFLDKHSRDRLTVLFEKRPDVKLWMVFANRRDKLKFERSRLAKRCERICVIGELK
jgi:hypothetical protein